MPSMDLYFKDILELTPDNGGALLKVAYTTNWADFLTPYAPTDAIAYVYSWTVFVQSDIVPNRWQVLGRGIKVLLNTLPAGVTITGATLHAYGGVQFAKPGINPNFAFYKATPANIDSIAVSDWSSGVDSRPYSDALYSDDFLTWGWHEIALNSLFLEDLAANNSLAIIIRFVDADVGGTPPWTPAGAAQHAIGFDSFAFTSDQHPYVTVTYEESKAGNILLTKKIFNRI